jgi:hypothetical protein
MSALDLRQFTIWCRNHPLPLFAVRRADIGCFARDLEAGGRARATVTRRQYTIAGFCKYAVEEELLDHSPAAHVRRPWVDDESHATAPDRSKMGALPVAAGLGPGVPLRDVQEAAPHADPRTRAPARDLTGATFQPEARP